MRKRVCARDKNKLVAAWMIAPNVFFLRRCAWRLSQSHGRRRRPSGAARVAIGAARKGVSKYIKRQFCLKVVVATEWPLGLSEQHPQFNRFSRYCISMSSTSSSARKTRSARDATEPGRRKNAMEKQDAPEKAWKRWLLRRAEEKIIDYTFIKIADTTK